MIRRSSPRNIRTWVSATDVFCSLVAAFLLLGSLGTAGVAGRGPRTSEARLERDRKELARCKRELDELTDRLQAARRRSANASGSDPTGEIRKLEEVLSARQAARDRLLARVKDLRTGLKDSPGAEPKQADSLERLALAVKRAEKARDELTRKAAELQDAASEGGAPRPTEPLPGRAVEIVVVKDTIVPKTKHYYSQKPCRFMAGGRIVSGTKIDRIRDGQPVGEALAPGGCLRKILAGIDPKTEHVMFLVAPDSVRAFRAAAKAVRSGGVANGWRVWPGDDTVIATRRPRRAADGWGYPPTK